MGGKGQRVTSRGGEVEAALVGCLSPGMSLNSSFAFLIVLSNARRSPYHVCKLSYVQILFLVILF